jgi:hypothetical protein
MKSSSKKLKFNTTKVITKTTNVSQLTLEIADAIIEIKEMRAGKIPVLSLKDI